MPGEVYAGGTPYFNEQYPYEWMNAASSFNDLLKELVPTLQELGDLFGFLPNREPEPQVIEVEPVPPRPWYQELPPWVLGAGAAVGVLILFKLLGD